MPKKIVVLGGGMAALSNVLALTNVPNWQNLYDITVYQMGWRLGGKCASGRNAQEHDRIEEHGLHVWGGFYENAFWMIKNVYKELGRTTGPIQTWRQAFMGQDTFFLKKDMNSWDYWSFCMPTCASDEPGFDPDRAKVTIRDIVFQLLDALQDQFQLLATPIPVAHFPLGIGPWELAQALLGQLLEGVRASLASRVLPIAHQALDLLAELLRKVRSAVKLVVTLNPNHTSEEKQRQWTFYDYLLTTLIGMLADNLLVNSFDNKIGKIECGAWLKGHGLEPATWESPLIHGMYDLLFGFPSGRFGLNERNVDASAMLKVMLQIIRYRGHAIYRMTAGMGDAIIAPIYEVLKARGVKFHFFHTVTNLKLSADKKRVESIDLRKQVQLLNGTDDYAPLVSLDGLPCWMSEPLYDQIQNGDALKTEIRSGRVNLESPNSNWVAGSSNKTLRLGQDYDEIVFGISIGAVPFVCSELIAADNKWKEMVKNIVTIPTQSLQLWIHPPLSNLNWMRAPANAISFALGDNLLPMLGCQQPDNTPHSTKFTTQPPMVGGVYTDVDETMDTWVAMDQLIHFEHYPPGDVGTIAYLTGILNVGDWNPLVEINHTAARTTAIANSNHFLTNLAPQLWGGGTTPLPPDQSWIRDQYVRSNTFPSDLYVLSVTGSKGFRLSCREKHFSNVWIVGDWTRNGLDIGYVEAAVTSGLLCARSILREAGVTDALMRVVGGDDYYWLGNES